MVAAIFAVGEEALLAPSHAFVKARTGPAGRINFAALAIDQHHNPAVFGVLLVALGERIRILVLRCGVEALLFIAGENKERIELAATLVVCLAALVRPLAKKSRSLTFEAAGDFVHVRQEQLLSLIRILGRADDRRRWR